MESLEVNVQNQAGHRAIVIDDNGIVELLIGNDGKTENIQIKCDYLPGQIDFVKYKDFGIERFMANCDNQKFQNLVMEAAKYGYKLESTPHSAAECQMIFDGMQLECKITGNPIDFFIPHAYTEQQAFNLIAQRGVAAAKAAAKFGGALAVSVAVAEVLSGNKTMEEAAKDALKSTARTFFYSGVAGNAIMSTALGPIVTTAITSVTNGIAGVLSSTTVGAKLIVAGTTVVNSASAVTAASAIFKIGGVTATAINEVSSLATAGTYAMGMGQVSTGIVALGSGVASALGAVTGGAAIATGAIVTGVTTATAVIGSAAAVVFSPIALAGMGLYGIWRALRD
ncbi:MAG: hypothetical protein IKT98_01045 [Selenomonadaceae bacterium]|nr:hypothetical protein [Selenomonadaceae bacterium]